MKENTQSKLYLHKP